jgi:predicted permease
MLANIRCTVRGFRRSPGFVIAAIVSLALGIGANTAIFSLINAILLRPLPVREPNRLVLFTLSQPDKYAGSTVPSALYRQMRDQSDVLTGLAAFTGMPMTTISDEGAERTQGLAVSGNFFETLGVSASIGRVLTAEDERGRELVCVISYGFWLRRFGGVPTAVGQNLQINGQSYKVIGVTPREFIGINQNSRSDVTIPFPSSDERPMIFGRLKPGVTIAQAQLSLDALFQHLGGSQGALRRFGTAGKLRVVLEPGARGFQGIRHQYERPLVMLMMVVGLVLLIACANLTNLLMARASGRTKEIAIRLALGAGRRRLAGELLTEILLLTIGGGALGMALAYWMDRALIAVAPGRAVVVDVHPDWRVLLFTLSVAILVCLLSGLTPAIQATRPDMSDALKGGTGIRAPRRFSLTNGLVVAQIALSSVLLIGAGLFLRSLHNLKSVDPGFDPESLVVLTVTRPDIFDRIIDRVQGLPGVIAASPSLISMLNGDFSAAPISVPGYQPQPNEEPLIAVNWIGADFFKTVGTPLVAGRMFTDQDGTTKKVAIVNEKTATHFWPNENPIGKHALIGPAQSREDCEIVGVVKDVKSESLRKQPGAIVYLPFRQNRRPRMTLHVRVAGAAEPVMSALVREVRALDSNAVPEVTTMAAQIDESLAADRLMATLTVLFGLLGGTLAAVGLYGVVAFTVAARTREIGIRIALGATHGRVLRQVVKESAVLIMLGLALGLSAAVSASRAVGSLLYGLSPTDPWTYSVLAALLAGIALSAAYIPARRAARVDPMVALRYD